MTRTAETQRLWKGRALWSRGFRPFFLAAGLWAVAAIAIWPPFFTGEIEIQTAFSARDWHVREMIYGYASAVVAGFLLTAIPNWTGRLPVAGWRWEPITIDLGRFNSPRRGSFAELLIIIVQKRSTRNFEHVAWAPKKRQAI